MIKATIFDIVRNSFVDGPGIRTTVFFKGCNLKCAWCHNPESQDFKPQMMFYKDKCTGCGKCTEVCPTPKNCTLCGKCSFYCPIDARKVCGKEYTVDEVFDEIIKDKAFYENSGGGVTFSGGEPLMQIDFLIDLFEKVKANNLTTCIDTSGILFDKNNKAFVSKIDKLLNLCDLVMLDIKHIDENGIEYWYARELMPILQYSNWQNFEKIIDKANNNDVKIFEITFS